MLPYKHRMNQLKKQSQERSAKGHQGPMKKENSLK
jgi:hypothetical protein